MKVPTKVRSQPPGWCRAALYLALWPKPEFYEYRVKLQREYLRQLKRQGRMAARRYAIRQTIHWSVVAGWRLVKTATFSRIAG
jgi:hypothetical protein